MLRSHVLIVFTVLVLASAVGAWAAGPVIGLAVSSGRLEVDRAPVDGNANLTDGALVRATSAPARLQMNSGAQMTLAPLASAKVYSDRIVLESGVALFRPHVGVSLEAGEFRILATELSGQAVVERRSAGEIQVAAREANVPVFDRQGVLLARVTPGTPLTFEPSPEGTAPTSQVRGKLAQRDGKYVLQDDLTHVQVELTGDNLGRFVNHRVEASGTAERGTGTESQKILVSRLSLADDNSKEPEQGDAGTPGQGSAAPKTSAGLSRGAKIGIGLGIAAGVGLGAGIPLATISR